MQMHAIEADEFISGCRPGTRWRLALAVCAIAASALIAASAAHAAIGSTGPTTLAARSDFPGSLSYANLDGSGGGQQPTGPPQHSSRVMGMAIDSATGRLYWANYDDSADDGLGTMISWRIWMEGERQLVPGAPR